MRGMRMLPTHGEFLERLYRENFGKIAIYATAALRDRSKAQDIAQDVFHKAVLHIDKLIMHENPEGWLMQTAKNKIRESERIRIRYIRRFLSLDSGAFTGAFAHDETENLESDEKAIVNKIEQTLMPEEFYLLKRLIFDNASHKDVARELDITVWASQKRLERIRKKLFEVFPERKKKK